MDRIVQGLKRVLTAIWLLVAASQVLTIVQRADDLPALDRQIEKLGDEPFFADDKFFWEEFRERRRTELIGAVILAPISIGLAYWKWSSRGREASAGNQSQAKEQRLETRAEPGAASARRDA